MTVGMNQSDEVFRHSNVDECRVMDLPRIVHPDVRSRFNKTTDFSCRLTSAVSTICTTYREIPIAAAMPTVTIHR